jgi:two-component system OmpR family response regulator
MAAARRAFSTFTSPSAWARADWAAAKRPAAALAFYWAEASSPAVSARAGWGVRNPIRRTATAAAMAGRRTGRQSTEAGWRRASPLAHKVRFVRLLVVEDDDRIARLLIKSLQRDGYGVDLVRTGDEGIWMATENDYDAIVLDVGLPGTNGLDVCRRLRQLERWAPILFLSARVGIEDRVRGLDAGADDYLAKPFSVAELRARLRALIRRSPRERPAVLTVGDLELDPASHRVSRAGDAVELTAKEFALLELFMRHPGDALSRRRILDEVWDFAYDGTSNVVDVYVRYLREKLGTDVIETVRGVGYRLAVG